MQSFSMSVSHYLSVKPIPSRPDDFILSESWGFYDSRLGKSFGLGVASGGAIYSSLSPEKEPTALDNQTFINSWRTSPAVELEQTWHNEVVLDTEGFWVPEPILKAFEETIGIDTQLPGFSSKQLILAPTRKFSFDPPQLHTMPDLPEEEWYGFDWKGMLEGVDRRWLSSSNPTLPEDLSAKTNELINGLEATMHIFPSPTDEKMAAFWQALIQEGIPPTLRYQQILEQERNDFIQSACRILGIGAEKNPAGQQTTPEKYDSHYDEILCVINQQMQTRLQISAGDHWKDQESNAQESGSTVYSNVLAEIKKLPEYEKTFDNTLPYKERELIRIMLDKRMVIMLNEGWQQFLFDLQQSILRKEPLKAALAAVA